MENYTERFTLLAKNWAFYFVIIAVASAIAFFIKPYIPAEFASNKALSFLSVFFPAWGTLASLIWKIQSFDGGTPPEKLNTTLLAICYVIGIVLFIITTA